MAKGGDEMEREEFLMPSVEIIKFSAEDVITTSGGTGFEEDEF